MVLENDVLTSLERLIEQGDDAWEALVSAGIQAQERKDKSVWMIGDLACLVTTRYGQDAIGDFAKSIKVEVNRVREYRTVCRFWDRKTSARAELLETCPNLYYSHYREAMRLKEMDEAITFLQECSENDWTIEATRLELDKRLGKRVPPQKLLDLEAVQIAAMKGELVTFDLRASAHVLAEIYASGLGIRLVVYEPDTVQEAEHAAVR